VHHLVVGAGPAGVTACEVLRRHDPQARITVLGGEPGAPYARMALPYLLSGKIEEAGTRLRRDPDFLDRLGVELVHARVAGLAPDRDAVLLEGGDALGFDRLLLATGASPVRPPVSGMDLPGVEDCWTLADARAISARARAGSRVVLIGAGFIGCILLEALVTRGVALTVVEQGPRMVPRMLDAVAGGMLQRWCETRGVRVRVRSTVSAVAAADGGLAVELDDGTVIPADLVISAAGVRSNTGFLAGSGVETEQGVLVDEYLHSSRAGVYAAGDVAQGRDLSTGAGAVHAIQPTAVEHGRVAAINMARPGTVPYQGSLNMNVLDTLGLISSSFGLWQGAGDGASATLEDGAGYRYLSLSFAQDRLVGAICLGYREHLGAIRGLIQSRRRLGPWLDRLKADPTALTEAYIARVQASA